MAISEDGFTPLHLTAFFGHEDTAEILMEAGSDSNHVAAGNTAIAKMLLESGADPARKQHGGYTPLHEAAINGNYEIVKLLLEHMCVINTRNDEGETPLDLTMAHAEDLGLSRNRENVANLIYGISEN